MPMRILKNIQISTTTPKPTHLFGIDEELGYPRRAVRVPILVIQIFDDLLQRAGAHVREAYDPLLGLAKVPLEHDAEGLDLEGDAAGEEDFETLRGYEFDVGGFVLVVFHDGCISLLLLLSIGLRPGCRRHALRSASSLFCYVLT